MLNIKYIPLGLFIAFSLKGLVNNFNYLDVIAVLIFASFAFLYEFFINSKNLSEIHSKLAENKEKLEQAHKDIVELRSHMAGIKLGQNFKSTFGK